MMHALRTRALMVAGVALLVSASACSSSSSRTAASSSSSVGDSTTSSSVVGDATTSVATTVPATVPATNPPATNPPATNPPATNPPVTNPPVTGPKVVSATFNGPSVCPAPDVSTNLPPQTVSISWVATGADSVYIAIDNPEGPYQSNLPLTGSISGLPFGCPGSHTYYVVAVKGGERDVESKTFGG